MRAGPPGAVRNARRKKKNRPKGRFHVDLIGKARPYLILVSLNSTCLRATGSYFFFDIFSVIVREFFFVT